MVSCIVITILSLSRKKKILDEDAGTGEMPKGKIEKGKGIWDRYLDFREKEKEFRDQFSSSRKERENLTQRIKKSATFSNLEKRKRDPPYPYFCLNLFLSKEDENHP